MNSGEVTLAALALALIEDVREVPARERKLAHGMDAPDTQVIAETRAQILAGHDPLGTEFCLLRSRIERRKNGATYTPQLIVGAMLGWAEEHSAKPARIVDPGCGSGRFLIAAAQKFPKAKLIGVDIDPLATLMLRANAAVLGFQSRLKIVHGDYRGFTLPKIDGQTIFIGNPPYVRHHDIAEEWKTWLVDNARKCGFKASKLAGLHIHFFLKTRQIAKTGDIGAFITAAEWLDVNYGSLLRDLLADGLGGASIQLIDPKAQPFTDAMTTGAITCFYVGKRPKSVTLSHAKTLAELTSPSFENTVPWQDLEVSPKWTPFIFGRQERPEGFIELGELFRVHRGAVTGNNAVWVENPFAQEVPDRFKHPAITRARELMSVEGELVDAKRLKRVIGLPVDLDDLSRQEKRQVERYLQWAEQQGAAASYVARHRRSWWSVQLRDPAPILCTYMARRAPTFVMNSANALHLNIAHGLYPRDTLPAQVLKAIVNHLLHNIDVTAGRTYAGGLVKFEPKELERILIPPLEFFHEASEKMDPRTASQRRRRGARAVSPGTVGGTA